MTYNDDEAAKSYQGLQRIAQARDPDLVRRFVAQHEKLKFDLAPAIQQFKSLIPLNKDKIWTTICDIEEVFQLQPFSELVKLQIPLFFRRLTTLIPNNLETSSYRKE